MFLRLFAILKASDLNMQQISSRKASQHCSLQQSPAIYHAYLQTLHRDVGTSSETPEFRPSAYEEAKHRGY